MPWTNPVDPVSSTVITVAYAVANILNPLRHLRTMTGNADPPGSSYALVSDSVAATSWKKVPPDALAAGAVVAHLGYTPLNQAGDNVLGSLLLNNSTFLYGRDTGGTARILAVVGGDNVARLGDPALPLELLTSLAVQLANSRYLRGRNTAGNPVDLAVVGGDNIVRLGSLTQPLRLNWSGGVDFFDGVNAYAPIHTGNIAAQSVASAATATTATTATTAASATTAANATNLQNIPPSAVPAPGRIPVSDGSGKLDAWVTPAAFSIPSGLGCWVRQASEIPAGFARETSLDGLMLIGAGTSFGQTFNEQQTYGNTWQHQHTVPSVAVAVSSVSVSVSVSGSAVGGAGDNTGASAAVNGLATAGGVSLNTTGHTHPLNGVSLAVSASGGGSGTGSGSTTAGSTGNLTWIPPLRAVVWARKT